mmetsp:Transcript_14488/g.21284  ORF Transcript_14488/g.21284 Transcript_14488/m.21284 type:complete len:176 (-) Transcript_14488:199-726(-)|eukprot:CAMPEP_0194026178 /NCGR_PEP_ID=MMETSP0009_2-20130614/489_1 /TAXON_ID=210454 /ORGANISM="Grammatophora oceanica, Strain CCMP 410" /LENGTH=175 /DNA_ID=CAMNT_0038664731 /DNA_START=105 /DNA_END=632 /DNA_ORIENTATION=-
MGEKNGQVRRQRKVFEVPSAEEHPSERRASVTETVFDEEAMWTRVLDGHLSMSMSMETRMFTDGLLPPPTANGEDAPESDVVVKDSEDVGVSVASDKSSDNEKVAAGAGEISAKAPNAIGNNSSESETPVALIASLVALVVVVGLVALNRRLGRSSRRNRDVSVESGNNLDVTMT